MNINSNKNYLKILSLLKNKIILLYKHLQKLCTMIVIRNSAEMW